MKMTLTKASAIKGSILHGS